MVRNSVFIAVTVILLFSPFVVDAATYYVATNGNDSWPGSSSQPWLTLQKAADTVVAGDTVIVRNGTYAGFRATESKSGSSGSPITMRAENTGQVTLNAKPSGARHNGIIELEGYWDVSTPVTYWIVEGFVMDGVNKTLMTLDTRWVDHCTFRSITAHHSSSRGLYISHGNYNVMENCTSYSNGEHGSYQANSATYNTYRGNTCYSNTSCGFHNNGDLTGGGTGRVDYTLYEKNTAYGNPGKAFNCDGVCNSTFRNNLVYSNSGAGFGLYITDASKGSSDNLVYNNTVVMPSAGDFCLKIPSASYSGGSGPDPTGNKVKNNILVAPSGDGSITTYSSSVSGFESDYNVVMDSFSIDDEGSTVNLATWRTYGWDTHSLISNPTALFVNPGSNDYHLKDGSPAINAGTTLSGVTDDKDGISRPQGAAYDIGCYEKQQASSLNITTTSLPDGQIGVAYSQTLQATGGTTPYTWSLDAGSLPAGLSLSSAGVISGTPTTAGTSNFTVKVTDAVSATDTQALSIVIPADLVVTTSSLANGQIGTAYSQTLAASGGKTPYSWSLASGSLPAGLSLSSGGVISGTPTTAGTSNFTVRVTDSQSPADTATKALSIAIYADLTVTTSSLPDAQVGAAYSQTLAASGGKTPYTWSLQSGSLPAGLSLSSGGVISGTPTTGGTSNFTVRVTDSESPADTATKPLSIIVIADLVITTTSLSDGQTGTAYSQTLAATGGKAPLTWSLDSGSLPAGLTLSSGGVISGTPTAAGTSNFTVKVTDSQSPADTATKALAIRIYVDLTVTTSSLPNGQIGVAYSQTLAASGGLTPYSWSLASGSLPAGLSLSSGGVISGTPTTAGTSNFTVRATDSESPADTATKALSIVIPPDLSITTSSLPNGVVGTAYSQTLAATGGVTPYSWSLASGSLPAGLSLSSGGVISGTPTTAGTSNFTVRVTDSQAPADTATKALSIVVTSGGTSATYQFVASDTESSTTSTSFVNKTTMSFTPTVSDSWIVFASAELKESSASYQTVIQVTIDGAVAQDGQVAPKTTSEYHAFTAMKVVTLSAASHTMNIDYKTSNASGTAYTRNARIVAIRKAALELYSNDGGDAGADLTTTMTDYATVSWTCPASADYLLVYSCSWNANTTSYYTTIEGRFNGGALDLTTVVANNASNHYTFVGQKTAWCDAGISQTMTLAAAKQSGSTAVHHLERARVAAFNLTTGRFSGFVKARSDAESTTTSTAYQQKLTMPVSVGAAGNWFVVCTWRLTNSSTSYASEAQLQLDNTTTQANQLRRPQNTADYFQCGCVDVRNLSAGTRTFDVDYRSKNTAGTAKIKNVHLIAIPL